MQRESRLTATTPDGKCHPAKPTWKEKLFGFSVAVEMGSDRTRVFVAGHGIAADEASAVLSKRNGTVSGKSSWRWGTGPCGRGKASGPSCGVASRI